MGIPRLRSLGQRPHPLAGSHFLFGFVFTRDVLAGVAVVIAAILLYGGTCEALTERHAAPTHAYQSVAPAEDDAKEDETLRSDSAGEEDET